MRFKYKHTVWIKIFAYALIALLTYVVASNICRWLGLFNMLTKGVLYEVTVSVICVFSIIVAINILLLNYRIGENYVYLRLMFFDSYGGQLKIANIAKLVRDDKESRLILCYTDKKENPQIILVNINPEAFDAFAAALREKNSYIIYEINGKDAEDSVDTE